MESILDMFPVFFYAGRGKSPLLSQRAVAGREFLFMIVREQHFLLSPLACPTAKPGGAVNGGAYAPFILAVDWLDWFCYFPNKRGVISLFIIAYSARKGQRLHVLLLLIRPV